MSLNDRLARGSLCKEADGNADGLHEALFQALADWTGLADEAGKRGAEQDRQDFLPRE